MEEGGSSVFVKPLVPTPETLAKLIKRLCILTMTLLPLEVDPDSINDPTSRVITPKVIIAYIQAAGTLLRRYAAPLRDNLPYCLLRARRDFMIEANRNAADYGENRGRAIACEVLARRVVHNAPTDRIPVIMSSRYRHRQSDGDIEFSSAIELAIDSHCTIFLSSSEAQDVINALWRGDLVQRRDDDRNVVYVPAYDGGDSSFWSHWDPTRIAIPRYQNTLRIFIWLFFLVVYSQAVREPLDRLDPLRRHFDLWEIVLYIMALAFSFEVFIFKTLRFATWRAFGFWHLASFITDALLLTAFILRVYGLASPEGNRDQLLLRKLVTVFDGHKYVGTMQICVSRMFRESGIFFALLSILGIGFLQGLYALDAADGEVGSSIDVMHVMVQSLLQAPNYDKFAGSAAGMTLYYFWNVVTALVLINVLISLFSSAYSDVKGGISHVFANKAVAMIRAPDTYVYPAPFNLVETILSHLGLNRSFMTVLFFIPMTVIAFYESTPSKKNWLDDFINGTPLDEDDSLAARDPEVPFSELVKVFPNTHESGEANIVKEIHELKTQLDALIRSLDVRSPSHFLGRFDVVTD
ncbi:hypothetical protein BJV77DRAFT_1058294 [Russula vinacea]|nr:hypothetical protein BJV77DRAFT_1058294 [Russula vinacea]